MALEIEMTGSGTIGPILPNWTVTENATPVMIGEYASGAGAVSFSAVAKDDSLFLANNNVVTTYTDFAKDLGSVSGVVKSISQSAGTINVTHVNKLSLFDADYNIPYLNSGNLWTAVDLLTQLTGTKRISIAPFEEII
jgi:hypothetical protein